jgi:hypothetical protein
MVNTLQVLGARWSVGQGKSRRLLPASKSFVIEEVLGTKGKEKVQMAHSQEENIGAKTTPTARIGGLGRRARTLPVHDGHPVLVL